MRSDKSGQAGPVWGQAAGVWLEGTLELLSGWEEEEVGGRECGDSRVRALGGGSGLSDRKDSEKLRWLWCKPGRPHVT